MKNDKLKVCKDVEEAEGFIKGEKIVVKDVFSHAGTIIVCYYESEKR